jgi:hypothetical protein
MQTVSWRANLMRIPRRHRAGPIGSSTGAFQSLEPTQTDFHADIVPVRPIPAPVRSGPGSRLKPNCASVSAPLHPGPGTGSLMLKGETNWTILCEETGPSPPVLMNDFSDPHSSDAHPIDRTPPELSQIVRRHYAWRAPSLCG